MESAKESSHEEVARKIADLMRRTPTVFLMGRLQMLQLRAWEAEEGSEALSKVMADLDSFERCNGPCLMRAS